MTKRHIKRKENMNELLKIDTSDAERITVSARDLHKALEVSTDFNHWFTRMCEYGFEAKKRLYDIFVRKYWRKTITRCTNHSRYGERNRNVTAY